jgi:two-component system response regulator HydG
MSGIGAGFVAESESMRDLVKILPRVAASDAPVVIEGETGSGKGRLAEAIHRLSPRRARPFEVLSCGAIPETLADSELFGHARGAFTHAFDAQPGRIERADGGTLLLDHVEDLPASIQPKLLRALEDERVQRLGETQERQVDVRFLATCRSPLKEAVAAGAFRDDLFHRLSVITLPLKPLRERTGDIRPLAEAALAEERRSGRTAAPGFTENAMRALEAHAWPGNVRELQSVVARAALEHRGDGPIGLAVLPADLSARAPALPATDAAAPTLPSLRDVERSYIALVLERTGGSRTETARILGISRKSLWERCRRFGLD